MQLFVCVPYCIYSNGKNVNLNVDIEPWFIKDVDKLCCFFITEKIKYHLIELLIAEALIISLYYISKIYHSVQERNTSFI